MFNIDIKTATEKTTTHTLNLDKKKLLAALNASLVGTVRIPEDAEVTIHVPGGGDWSDMDLTIDSDTPVEITWKTVSHSCDG